MKTWRAIFNNFPFTILAVAALAAGPRLVYHHQESSQVSPFVGICVCVTCGCWLNFSCVEEWHYPRVFAYFESHLVVLFLLFCVLCLGFNVLRANESFEIYFFVFVWQNFAPCLFLYATNNVIFSPFRSFGLPVFFNPSWCSIRTHSMAE